MEMILQLRMTVRSALLMIMLSLFSLPMLGVSFLICYKYVISNRPLDFQIILALLLCLSIGIYLLHHLFKMWTGSLAMNKLILDDDDNVVLVKRNGKEYSFDIPEDLSQLYKDDQEYEVMLKKGRKLFIVNSNNIKDFEQAEVLYNRLAKYAEKG